jgi:quercetin dioxygenase-like cupin family protein
MNVHGYRERTENMKVRRVVTGHTPDGKAVVASDMEIDAIEFPLTPGSEHHKLWGADIMPTFPDNGAPYPMFTYFPPVGGFRFGLFSIPPESVAPPENYDWEKALRETEERFPGLLACVEPDTPDIHTTNTIDFEYVISGEVFLELDDGVEVHLQPGDTVVQNGTRHAWRNKGTEPCRLVLCMIGTHRIKPTS